MDGELYKLMALITAVLVFLTGLSYPILKMIRKMNVDNKDNVKDSAEASLYRHLSEQVKKLSDDLDKQRQDNSALIAEVSVLRGKVTHLEDVHDSNLKLKERLDAKDAIIKDLNADNHRKAAKIAHLEHEVLELNLKLKDIETEKMWNVEKQCINICDNRILPESKDINICVKGECINRLKHTPHVFKLDDEE